MMDIFFSIALSGLTSGAMYALATLGLSLVWGSMGMLNMAHGAMLTLGGYAAFAVVMQMGLPGPLGFVAALGAGALVGALLYMLVVKPLLRAEVASFETAVLMATVGLATALENSILLTFGGQPLAQPVKSDGMLQIGQQGVPYQSMVVIGVALILMGITAYVLQHTRAGRAIRATTQNRDAAQLLGIPVGRVYLQVLMFSGALAGICGCLVSSITQLSPTLGADPMLKAFIMCVVAGLGNLPGAVLAAFALAFIEAIVQYVFGGRWGFPVLLGLVILVLVWRPTGLFGRTQIRRL